MRRATNTINFGTTLPLAQGVKFDIGDLAGSGPSDEVVMAGLVPATPIVWHGRAPFIGVAGTRPGDDQWRSPH